MKKLALICTALCVSSCGQQAAKTTSPNDPPAPIKSMTLEDIDFASYSEDLAKFVGLENGEDRWAAIDKMRLYFAPEDGQTILNTKTSSFDPVSYTHLTLPTIYSV